MLFSSTHLCGSLPSTNQVPFPSQLLKCTCGNVKHLHRHLIYDQHHCLYYRATEAKSLSVFKSIQIQFLLFGSSCKHPTPKPQPPTSALAENQTEVPWKSAQRKRQDNSQDHYLPLQGIGAQGALPALGLPLPPSWESPGNSLCSACQERAHCARTRHPRALQGNMKVFSLFSILLPSPCCHGPIT